ncbi:PepSY-associated TM helix domain-containing protein [Methylomonas sp. UP202]|uniref:PepSY-associated TM helix domain-containing protein n=1 Tax=Methylomonas sp. UP202 TaxID=3040943 RepID=UPI00247AFEE5|nr:PepSY-associated TM helix domain-containing protein [Methylomonas sp. UP202]WGS83842.1 PepSY-associated TM helix domain-containing protein [Methylomonas sp. UP202]
MKPASENYSRMAELASSAVSARRLNALKARRKRWLAFHLYLGLSAGLLLAVVGLTGGILVFYQELQEILNPELSVVSLPAEGRRNLRPLDDIVAAAENAKPAGSHFFKVYYPRKADIAYKFLYFVREQTPSGKGDGYYIFVDPYTARVQGLQLWHPKDRYWGRPLVSFIMQLHWCLLMGKSGGTIVAILGAFSIISVLTGLIVWWPLTGKFRQALTFKANAGSVRFNFDLHKTAGFYSGIALLPVLFSGIYMTLPERVDVVVKPFSTMTRPNAYSGIPETIDSATPAEGQATISLSRVEAIVQKNYPGGRLWMLNAPKDRTDVFRVMKRDIEELSRFVGYREIAVDQYSGEILKVYDAGTGSNADVFYDWQWPLHSGHAFGWPGRILVLLSGLACPVLFVTGVIRWLQKRRAKRLSRAMGSVTSGR